MVAKTFTNLINPVEVSLAIEQVLIAPFGTNFDPTTGRVKTDITSLPSGFFHLGAVVEDEVQFQGQRPKFQLRTGVPAVLQYEAVIGIEGNLSGMLHSNNWRKLDRVLGNFSTVSSATLVTSITSVVNQNVIHVGAATSIIVGRQYTISTAARVDAADAIEGIVGAVSGTEVTFNAQGAAGLINTPTIAMNAYYAPYVRQAWGGSNIRQFELLGVADFINGQQIVHHFRKCVPAEELTEKFMRSENNRIPFQFNAFGTVTTAYDSGNDQLIVMERYSYPAGS